MPLWKKWVAVLMVAAPLGVVAACDPPAADFRAFRDACIADGLRAETLYDEWGNIEKVYCFDAVTARPVRHFPATR